jgi:hypothetical protein
MVLANDALHRSKRLPAPLATKQFLRDSSFLDPYHTIPSELPHGTKVTEKTCIKFRQERVHLSEDSLAFRDYPEQIGTWRKEKMHFEFLKAKPIRKTLKFTQYHRPFILSSKFWGQASRQPEKGMLSHGFCESCSSIWL